jgi:hypothetical protein
MASPTSVAKIDAVASHRDTLVAKAYQLTTAEGDRAIGADNSVPRNIRGCGGEDSTHETWRTWVDVAVGLDVTFRDGPNSFEDPRRAIVGARVLALGDHEPSSRAPSGSVRVR